MGFIGCLQGDMVDARGRTFQLVLFGWAKATLRVPLFLWEAARECTLTLDKLVRRGNVLVNRYYSCKRDAESCNHIFLWYPFLFQLWNLAYGLLGLNYLVAGLIKEEIGAWKGIHGEKRLGLIPLASFWSFGRKRTGGFL